MKKPLDLGFLDFSPVERRAAAREDALAGRLGLVDLSSGMVRKELAGLRPTDRCPEASGERLSMTRRTYATLRRAG